MRPLLVDCRRFARGPVDRPRCADDSEDRVREVQAAERARGHPRRPTSTVPLVAVNVWYHVGSGDEVVGRSGFAHLFEHMMFQGSKNVGEDKPLRDPARRSASTRSTARRTPTARTTTRWCRRTSSRPRCGSRAIAWATCSSSLDQARRSTTRSTSCATSAARTTTTCRTARRCSRCTRRCTPRAIRTAT